ncbi:MULTISPECIES: hypothetical protein [unclassified Massilia]|uniref:hypothetical protein n=1 Tax=unclassified Massilia TaxID=2609279 RepID=UPI000A99D66B|nr:MULTISPECIES: hypothetical protein [unclassified Massilia]
MTSIVCWLNDDIFLKGLWAVADSRVTNAYGVLSDNVPKLFSIPLQYYMDGDVFHERPVKILWPMFGFSGSTLIGLNVKEILSNYLGNLSPISYYGGPLPTIEERTPTLFEIAELAKRIGEIYLRSVGQLSPGAAKCEFVLFGFCRRSGKFRVIKLFNTPEHPASITMEEHNLSGDDYVILGDRKNEVQARINEKRARFPRDSLNWGRSPILVMADILRSEGVSTIGGHMQIWAALEYKNHLLTISHMDNILPHHVGLSLFEDLGHVGGFTTGHAFGLSIPGPDGWPDSAT